MYACKHQDSKLARLLVEKYPNIINQEDENGWPGFLFSCDSNNINTTKLLLNMYPNIFN